MCKKNLSTMIDQAGSIDLEIKSFTKELKKRKVEILKEAEQSGIQKLDGKKFSLSISDVFSYTDVTPVECQEMLNSLGKGSEFYGVIKVQVSPLTKIIGENALNTIREIKGSSNRITLKEIK